MTITEDKQAAAGRPVATAHCSHKSIQCLNEYELIRKYRCEECGGVMMCACDERIGRKCLPHQLNVGAELETRRRMPVTLGFQPSICRECRGLPSEAHPKAAIHGCTTKIRRYYWRELQLQTLDRFTTWAESTDALGKSNQEKAKVRHDIETQVLEEIKELHARSPKYVYQKELSQAEIITKCEVDVLDLKATYVRNKDGGAATILDGSEPSVPRNLLRGTSAAAVSTRCFSRVRHSTFYSAFICGS